MKPTTDLKEALKDAQEAIAKAITVAVAHGRQVAMKEILAAVGGGAARRPTTTRREVPKQKKAFRKTKKWREAIARNLAKGRAARAAKLKAKQKREK